MVIMAKENWDAWMKLQNYGTEINWCMREQGFSNVSIDSEESSIYLEVFSELMSEYGAGE